MAVANYAQTTLVATLTHDDEVSCFYGENAFAKAHYAAVDGDLITLSSGNFTCTSITKALTIRGAGMETDAEKGIVNTTLGSGSGLAITLSTDTEYTLNVEGVFFGTLRNSTLKNTSFTKCSFSRIEQTCALVDATFTQCGFIEYFYNGVSSNNPLIINSYVRIGTVWNDNASATFVNCFIGDKGGYGLSTLKNCVFQNCILQDRYAGAPLPTTNIANNCVGYYYSTANGSSQSSIFRNLNSSQNNTWLGYRTSGIFSTGFELTDEMKQYLGDDGTEVGMYGGMYPYDPVPSGPRITKCEVAKRPTADGKLSVSIEVSTPEQ